MGVKEHEMHHRAQLMLIERMLGIVPHLTRQREAAVAARRPALPNGRLCGTLDAFLEPQSYLVEAQNLGGPRRTRRT